MDLHVINPLPSCIECPGAEYGQKVVGTDGAGSNGILLVGDSPWLDEVKASRPFAGAAGHYLDRCFARLGLTRNNFLIANSLWCKPQFLSKNDQPWRYPEVLEATEHCRPNLDGVIAKMKPKVIVTLGTVALRRVCGVEGLLHPHAPRLGYVHDSPYGIPVIPEPHPSFIMQGNQKWTPVLLYGLRRALEIASRSWKPTELQLTLDPSPDQLVDYLKGPIEELMIDIETPETSKLDEEEAVDASYDIVRCGVSKQAGEGYSFPWAHPWSSILLESLAGVEAILTWNGDFDLPRLMGAGAKLPRQRLDAMWLWHWLQSDLKKALGFVAPFYYSGPPWKHLAAAQPAYYNACDAAIQMLCFDGIRRDVQKQGRWEMWLRHCVEIKRLTDRMGPAGLYINPVAQQAFKEKLQGEYDAAFLKLQEQVPEAVKPRKLYKKGPKKLLAGESTIEIPDDSQDSELQSA